MYLRYSQGWNHWVALLAWSQNRVQTLLVKMWNLGKEEFSRGNLRVTNGWITQNERSGVNNSKLGFRSEKYKRMNTERLLNLGSLSCNLTGISWAFTAGEKISRVVAFLHVDETTVERSHFSTVLGRKYGPRLMSVPRIST